MSAARSVSPLLVAAVALTGCTTTQEVNKRYELRAQRVIAGREPVHVDEADANPAVRVDGVWAIRTEAKPKDDAEAQGGDDGKDDGKEGTKASGEDEVAQEAGGGAIVVELTNTGDEPLTDLPISVGVGDAEGKGTYVNERRGLEYFQTRVAAIAPGATTRWVYSSKRDIPEGEPFAIVGSQEEPSAGSVSVLPKLKVAAGDAAAAGKVHAEVTNGTDIPQYNLPVYALRRSEDGSYVAAGRTRIEELDDGSSSSVGIRLTGAATGEVVLEALPTIFR